MIQQLLWSLIFRPYVTLFLCVFLLLSYLEQGGQRTLIWLISGYLIAWSAEWSSINFGFPFGWYVYHYDVLANDLVVCGVPFFDSLSFTFLSYISFSFAQFFLSPLRGRGLAARRLTLRRVRNSKSALLLGSALMVVIDLIVDPLANLGKYWFLGDIYHYVEPGLHFGVPLLNYCGWFIAAMAIIFINQRADEFLADRKQPLPLSDRPYSAILAPGLWFGIILFQLGVTYWLAFADIAAPVDRERIMLLALTGSFIIAPILLLTIVQFIRLTERVSESELMHDETSCPHWRFKTVGKPETGND